MKIKRASLIIKIVIVAIILYAGINLVTMKAQVSGARNRRDELQTEVDSTMKTNSELEYAINHSDNKETLEDIARNKLGLVNPGEKIFYDVSN